MAQLIASFKINGQPVTPYTQWHAAQIVVQRDAEALTLAVELQRVKVIGDARQAVITAQNAMLGIPVELQVGTVVLRGRVFPGNIYFGPDYCVITAQLDTAGLFARMVEGQLLPESLRKDVKVLVSPRVDKATMLMLALSAFVILFLAAKETIELLRDIAKGIGVSGAGTTGPISSAIMMIALFALRVIYIASLILAFVQLIKQIKDLLQRTVNTRYFRLSDALHHFANNVGFTLSGVPPLLNDVYLVGGGIEQYEASELFRLAKQLTRSVLFVNNNQIKFISINSTLPANYRIAHEETYKHNLDELRRRTLISLVRDVSEEHTQGLICAAEIDRKGLVGLERVDIPFAPGTRAGNLKSFESIKNFIKAIAIFKGIAGNVNLTIKNMKEMLVVEREAFMPKILYGNVGKPGADNSKKLLEKIADAYIQPTARRVYENVRMPMDINTFTSLMNAGFPGVRGLRWRFADNVAEMDYEVNDNGFAINNNVIYV